MRDIYIGRTYEECSILVERLLTKDIHTLGFDTETTVERKDDHGKTSVVQIHTGRECYIFQVYRVWKDIGCFPSKLAKFMSNPLYIKVGVAAENDARKLEESYNIRCSGIIDVQHIARTLSLPDISLGGLAARYTPLLSKENKSNIYTNWDIDLDDKHIRYAATDALLSLLVYQNIFQIIPPDEEVVTFDIEEEDKLLLQWLSISNRLPARNMESIIKMVCSSYGRWAKIYTRSDKITMTQSAVERLVQAEKLICSNGEFILPGYKASSPSTSVPPTCNYGLLADEAMRIIVPQFGNKRKKESIVNQLCNSMSSISKLNPMEKKGIADSVVQYLIDSGKLLDNYGYCYLKSSEK